MTTTITSPALRLQTDDHVAVLRRPVTTGDLVLDVIARDDIPASHKIALHDIPSGGPVRKYGQVIGFAARAIRAGEHVHTHNLRMEMGDVARDYAFASAAIPLPPIAHTRTFMGYARPDGRVGTRNYVAVISSVNCSASVAAYVRDRFRTPDFTRDFPHVDGVVAFTHKSGCCVQPGMPAEMLQRTLAGLARHPNIAGYVMIGLGCETNQLSDLIESHSLKVLRPGEASPAFMMIQDTGGMARTVEAAAAAVAKLLPVANAHRRTPQSVSHLTLGLECGGSDGNSGITANPALGVASDTLIRHGGTAVLAETPEIYGAEHLLTRRAVSQAVGEKLVALVRWWEDHTRAAGATIDNNPTYGNKAGGLTTIYEKSLGAVAKAGQAPLVDVLHYAQRITTPGLNFMDTPGYDPVSLTGLVAGGCNLAAFTTGRGSVYGCKPAPCLKIATNTPLFERMNEDMDLNAGTILDGTETVQEVGTRIFETLLQIASGQKTKSEAQGLGDEEFAPWVIGPTL